MDRQNHLSIIHRPTALLRPGHCTGAPGCLVASRHLRHLRPDSSSAGFAAGGPCFYPVVSSRRGSPQHCASARNTGSRLREGFLPRASVTLLIRATMNAALANRYHESPQDGDNVMRPVRDAVRTARHEVPAIFIRLVTGEIRNDIRKKNCMHRNRPGIFMPCFHRSFLRPPGQNRCPSERDGNAQQQRQAHPFGFRNDPPAGPIRHDRRKRQI